MGPGLSKERGCEAGVIEVEEALARWLDPCSRVTRSVEGRIAIDFADLDDLRRIHRIMFGDELQVRLEAANLNLLLSIIASTTI